MGIKIQKGDLFDSGAEVFINTVNCRGVMGKGIALEFKRRFPAMYSEYVKLCKKGKIRPGKVWIWHECSEGCCILGPSILPHYIVNFPTKDDWKNPSQLQWIADGLDDLRNHATMNVWKSMALPALGCQNGGLKFEVVKKLIEEKLSGLTTEVILYEPQ